MARFMLPLVVLATSLPYVLSWGIVAHETIAYIASSFVTDTTKDFFQHLLGDDSDDYLAAVAGWADEWKFTDEGAFSAKYHSIDAHDDPPRSCEVDLERDCGDGCIVTAIANYTSQIVSASASEREMQIAAKLLIHLVGDIGQPLHCEAMELGGGNITVSYDRESTNLQHVWDTSMPEQIAEGGSRTEAKKWAKELSQEIRAGDFEDELDDWIESMDVNDMQATSLSWARESNQKVCEVVMPDGPGPVELGDLSATYETTAVSTIELQVARQGYRLAILLDAIAQAQE